MRDQPETAARSFREKAGYGLGDMASNFYMGFFGLYLLYYYTDVFGLAPSAVASSSRPAHCIMGWTAQATAKWTSSK